MGAIGSSADSSPNGKGFHIQNLPVKLILKYSGVTQVDEVRFSVRVKNPFGLLACTLDGFLDESSPEQSLLLPIRSIKGNWKVEVLLHGSEQRSLIYDLLLDSSSAGS